MKILDWFKKLLEDKPKENPKEEIKNEFETLDSISYNTPFKFDIEEFLDMQEALANHQLIEAQTNMLTYIRRKQCQYLANNVLFYKPLATKGITHIQQFADKQGEKWLKSQGEK